MSERVRLVVDGVVLEVTQAGADELREQLSAPVPASTRIDTKAAARLIGMGEDYVREHAAELGGWQPSRGGKWTFDPAKLAEVVGGGEDRIIRGDNSEGSELQASQRPRTPTRARAGDRVRLLDMKGD